jgi:hypothetical protein
MTFPQSDPAFAPGSENALGKSTIGTWLLIPSQLEPQRQVDGPYAKSSASFAVYLACTSCESANFLHPGNIIELYTQRCRSSRSLTR